MLHRSIPSVRGHAPTLLGWSRPLVVVAACTLTAGARAQEADGVTAKAQLQSWGTLFDQDEDPQADPAGYGDPEHDPGVSIHRARLGLEGLHGPLDWELLVGLGEPFDALVPPEDGDFGLIDAAAGGRFPFDGGSVRLSMGLQKVPFSREALISSRDLLFQERAVATNWLTAGREAGLLADLTLDMGLRLRGGAFNGNGGLFGDENTGELLAGRLEFGTGSTYRTWSPGGENAVGFGVSAMHDTGVATNTLSLGADALVRIGGLGLLVEAGREEQTPRDVDVAPPDVLEGVQRLGATAQISYFAPVGDGPDEGIEAGARFSMFDAASHLKDNGDVAIAHVGATWRQVWPGLDVGAGVVHRMERQGRPIANDTARIWMQLYREAPLGSGAASSSAHLEHTWAAGFVGTWTGEGDLDGATLALWEQPGMGLVGSFKMDREKGRVIVGRPYPLDSFVYENHILRVRLDPYGEGRDVVWFELSPNEDGKLCGYGYEDGRRHDAVGGEGGGAWVCWTRAS